MTQGRVTATAIADAVVTGGYASLTLDRLARQVCQVMDVEQASIVIRDPAHAGTAIAVAACGADEELVGSRFDERLGLAGRVLASGEPVVADRFAVAAPLGWNADVDGVVAARSRRRPLDRAALTLLSELAGTVGAAVDHAGRRLELLTSLKPRVAALMSAIEERDPYTAGHSGAVLDLSVALARSLGLSRPDLMELEAAALMHDLGKVGVPDAVLNKPGPLDDEEQALVRRHTLWGAKLLAEVTGLEPVATIVRFHHERWDGTGYPYGLEGSRVPIASRIIAVCDAYNAMTSDRPYRRRIPDQQAIGELERGAGSQFDPAIVECFLDGVQWRVTSPEGDQLELLGA
jgi:HD-GYP domain-containing protein (c-di-GMP phosphodiesterase class II)